MAVHSEKTNSKSSVFREDLRNLLILSLFPLFFVLHGINAYWDLIHPGIIIRLFLQYTLVGFGCYALSRTFLSPTKAFQFAFLLLAYYLFFGYVLDSIDALKPRNRFGSYRYFIPISVIFFISVGVWLRKKKSGKQFFKFLRLLIFVLLSFELGAVLLNKVTGKAAKNMLAQPVQLTDRLSSDSLQPDIFFIVFDEYEASDALKKYFNFDNSRIDSSFASNGFYQAVRGHSNYNQTVYSLASTLNLAYLDLKAKDSVFNTLLFAQAIKSIEESRLPSFLAKQGYTILNFGCFDFEEEKAATRPFFASYMAQLFHHQTFWARLRGDIGWNFSMKDWNGNRRIPSVFIQQKKEHLTHNRLTFDSLIQVLKEPAKKEPRFVYGHMMLPHDPYYLDSLGHERPDEDLVFKRIDREGSYLQQLKYANKLLLQLIPVAAGKSTRPRVVIIEGDHGYGYHDNVAFRSREFRNLNCFYFSDGDYSMLYPDISPVNSFRVVLNKYFNQNLPVLADSTHYFSVE